MASLPPSVQTLASSTTTSGSSARAAAAASASEPTSPTASRSSSAFTSSAMPSLAEGGHRRSGHGRSRGYGGKSLIALDFDPHWSGARRP